MVECLFFHFFMLSDAIWRLDQVSYSRIRFKKKKQLQRLLLSQRFFFPETTSSVPPTVEKARNPRKLHQNHLISNFIEAFSLLLLTNKKQKWKWLQIVSKTISIVVWLTHFCAILTQNFYNRHTSCPLPANHVANFF